MSERPTTGRRPRGAKRAVGGEDPSAELSSEEDAPDDASQARPRSRRALRVVGGAAAEPRGATRPRPRTEQELETSVPVEHDEREPVPAGEPPDVDDAEATHAGPPITVEVVEGPDAGRRKRVRGGRMVIGRGDGCDLKLRDTSCSRRHLELIVGFSGAMVRDLGSGNGTKVNGERVDEAQVGHGDEILVGTSILKIVDEIALLEERRRPKEEPPPEPEPAAEEAPAEAASEGEGASEGEEHPGTAQVEVPVSVRPNRLPLFLGLGMGGVIVVLLLAVLLRPSRPPPAPVVDTGSAEKYAKEARNALAKHDYDGALQAWEKVRHLDPNYPELDDYTLKIKAEQEWAQKVAAARAQMSQGQFAEARAALKAVPETVVGPRDEADALLKELDPAEIAALLAQAQQALSGHDYAAATAVLPRLGELDGAKAQALRQSIESARAEEERARAQQEAEDRRRGKKVKEIRKQKAEAAVRAELESGYRKFNDAVVPNQYERSATEFDRIAEGTKNADTRERAHELAQQVRTFAKALSEANQLDADQAYEAEIGPLDRATTALDRIEPSSPMMAKLKNRLSRGLIMKGRSAAARQEYGLAAKSFQKALQINPHTPEAKDGLQQLRGRAHDVYLQAYEEESRDPESARKLYNSVLQMLGPSDDDYQKAKRRLDGLAAH